MTNRTSRRQMLALLALATTLTLPTLPALASAPPRSTRRDADQRWVDGVVEIDAPPAVVRASLANVGGWAQLFSDVSSVRMKSRDGARQVAEVESRILGSHAHDFIVTDAGSRFDLIMEVTGIDAHGSMALQPGARENTTRATFSLYAATRGVAGMFLSEAALRRRQESIVQTYLTDLTRLQQR